MIFEKKDKKYFLKNRLDRVAIPLVSSLLVFTLFPTIINGDNLDLSVGHLWFLITLLILSAITTIDKVRDFFNQKKIKPLLFIASLIIYSIWMVITYLQSNIEENLNFFITQLISLPLYYSMFYFLGFMLYNQKNIEVISSKLTILIISAITFSISSVYLYYKKYAMNNIGIIEQLIKTYSDFFCGLSISLVLIIIMLKHSKSNKIINFLKDSSLVIYVSHFSILGAIAPIVDKYTNSVYTFYFLICFLTFLISTAIYLIFKKFYLTRLMFGIR
jgi:surface polysaccharide O-acyltransferase-like enzyme